MDSRKKKGAAVADSDAVEGGSAIAIVPPYSCWEVIDVIRRVHDKAIQRWDPHCNLFFPAPVFGDVQSKLLDAFSTIAPFEVTADHFYSNKGSKYVELGFADTKSILQVRECVRNTLKLALVEAYEPHITVGQCDQKKIDDFVKTLQRDWVPLSWTVSEVCLLHKEGKRYKPIARIPLGGGN